MRNDVTRRAPGRAIARAPKLPDSASDNVKRASRGASRSACFMYNSGALNPDIKGCHGGVDAIVQTIVESSKRNNNQTIG